MKTFIISANNDVMAVASPDDARLPEGAVKFATEKELTTLSAHWPGNRFVEIWNKLPGAKSVRKFTDRRTAVRRIWGRIQKLEIATVSPASIGPMQVGTKSARIIALLKQPSGATLKVLMAETGWQSHSVRGFISAQLSKRMGFRIKSFKRDGERVYRIRA